MKAKIVVCAICLSILSGAAGGTAFAESAESAESAEGAVRAGRVGAELRFDYGASGVDPIAQVGVDAEYGLLEHLSVGAGFAYVDGRMTQESCLELMVKGYLLGKPFDVFAAAALQLSFSAGLGTSGTLRIGVEWQSPWKFFLGAEAAGLLEQAGVGWMGGAFAGIRLQKVAPLLALILLPLLAGLVLLVVKSRTGRAAIVIAASALAAVGSLSLVFTHFPLADALFHVIPAGADVAVMVLEVALSALIFAIALRRRRPMVAVLAVLQAGMSLVTGLGFDSPGLVEHALAADKLSVIMAAIVGVVGGLIIVYSLGYMEAWHGHHREVRDRRRLFFFLQFVFLSAMFGILFSNSLPLLHLFWEVTTLCSFLLIGYDDTRQSRDRASLALVLNMLGGLAFSGAILFLAASSLPLEIDALVNAGAASTLGRAGTFGAVARSAALLPAVLLSFAGLTKSAQMPFSSWLLGAMSAPTPVSALLHSATMVKAGVYLIVRLSPILQGSLPGVMIALVGGVTFLLGSLAAVSQRDAKRVLAWSTIANLGLIVMCGGIGTYESVWAAILLVLFHAVTKALMFLTVGTVEQTTGSRDIEDMSGLILTMPRLSIMMQVGIAGMFIAPFGMLVSKWAVLRALVDYNPLLAVFVVFGSSATLFFWVKWMGKLLEVSRARPNVEAGIPTREWVVMIALAALTVALCGFYPLASTHLIEPYVVAVYGTAEGMSQGNIVIMSIMLGLVALFPLTFFVYGRRVKVVDPYLGGANVAADFHFQAAAGEEKGMRMSNYYLPHAFGERRLSTVGVIVCAVLVLVAIGVAL